MRLLLILFTIHCSLFTISARSVPTINAEKVHEAARQQVVWKGQVCTFSTLSCDFLKSVYGKTTYKGLSPEQVVYGWLYRPDAWKDEPMIRITDADLRRQLNIEGEYAKFSELFDDTLGYRLTALGSDLPERMRPLVREAPAVIELDERVGLIILLTQGQLIVPLSDSTTPLPSWRVEAEVLYNHHPYSLLIAGLAFISILLLIAIKKLT